MAWKHWASDARRELPKLVVAEPFRRRVASQVHCSLTTGQEFWPALAEAAEKVGGDVGAVLVGPGMYDALKAVGAAEKGSVVQCVEDLADRDVFVVGSHPHPADFLREFPAQKLARIVVMMEGGRRKLRASRQPRCDLVPPSAQPFGTDWRTWFRQFPVVARVKSRTLRRASVADDCTVTLHVGRTVPIVPGG